MKKKSSQFRLSEKFRDVAFRRKLLFGSAPIFLFAFFLAFMASSIFAPVNKSDATNLVSANVSYDGMYVKMNSSDVLMELVTTVNGAMTVVDSNVKTATNSPGGFELYVGMSQFDDGGAEKPNPDKQKNGLYLDGDLSRTDNAIFAPASGKAGEKGGSLAALTDNTWGYAVDKNSIGAPNIWLNENHSTMSSATPTNDKFAAVPPVGSEELVQETNSANVEIGTDPADVKDQDYTTANLYYGIRGTLARIPGYYSNTIAYTAVAKAPAIATDVTFNPASYTHIGGTPWDNQLIIATELYSGSQDLGGATVKLLGGPEGHANIDCPSTSVYTEDNIIKISCILPKVASGTYDIQIFLDKFDQTFTGTYTYNPEIYNVTVNKGTGIASVSGGGQQSGGSTVTLGATAATGYYHSGWTTDAGGITVDSNNQFVMPGNDVIVTANGSLNTCPISYDSNAPEGTTASGTTSPSTMTYGSESPLTLNGYVVGGYAFEGWAESATGEKAFDDGGSISGTTYCTVNNTPKTLYAVWSKKPGYSLVIKPNGGSWGGTTADTDITQEQGTRYPESGPLADATDGPTYTIDYDMGTTEIDKPTSPTSVDRPFTGWTKDGIGEWNETEKYWTFGEGDGSLTANWNNTSNSFNLPPLEKSGYICEWHQGSATGDVRQDDVTITGDTTFYAVCILNIHTLTIKPNGGSWGGTTADTDITQERGTRYPASGALPDATNGPTLSITYEANGQGASYVASPTSVSRPFSGWTKGGTGTWDATNKYWTFGAGDGILTANWSSVSDSFTLPTISKSGHNCYWASNSTGTKYGDGGSSHTISANLTVYAYCTVIQSTLTVNPNGGTWSGSTSSQTFTQNYGTTKSISNPTATPTYNIIYSANSQGASCSGISGTSCTGTVAVARSFTGWALSGAGSFAGGTYTYSEGNGALTAQYNSTSNSFTLPTITKSGYTCKWAQGSASGTQYSGGTSRTATGNTTYYAVCTVIPTPTPTYGTVNITNSNTTSSKAKMTIAVGSSTTVTVTPDSGYYLSAVTCPTGYTCSGYSTGATQTGKQTVTVKNNSSTGTKTLTFTGTALTLKQTCTNASRDTRFTYNSTDYIKFKNGACYTRYRTAIVSTWNNAVNSCPSGTALPTLAQQKSLVNSYGNSLYTVTSGEWHVAGIDNQYLWGAAATSTNAYYMKLYSNSVEVTGSNWPKDQDRGFGDNSPFGAVCIVK